MLCSFFLTPDKLVRWYKLKEEQVNCLISPCKGGGGGSNGDKTHKTPVCIIYFVNLDTKYVAKTGM
jgi:hypothetical protein